MTAPLKTIDGTGDIARVMGNIGRDARAAARVLALAPTAQKDRALDLMAKAVRTQKRDILAANGEDIAEARSGGAASAFIDRLTLDEAGIEAIAAGIEVVRGLKDPVGAVTENWTRPNGMTIERVRHPLGVVGIIYESRPNVTADAGALCLKAGDAAILRGGSESFRSSRAIHAALVHGIARSDSPAAAIQLVPTRDRAAVGAMLTGLDQASIDVIVPARRQGSGRARAGRSARAGVRASGRCSPGLHADKAASSEDGQDHRAQRQDAPDGRLRCSGNFADRPRAAATGTPKPLVEMLIDAGCKFAVTRLYKPPTNA